MAHAASAFSFRSDRISPSALALALLLHVLVAAALWWMSLDRPKLQPSEEPIDISFEKPKPPEPPPPPPPQPAPQPPPPAPAIPLGLAPPAAITADKATQVPQAQKPSKETPAPQPPSGLEALMPPEPKPPRPPAEGVALAPPPPPAPKPTPAPGPKRPELSPSPLTTAPSRRPAPVPNAEAPSPHPFVNPADAYSRAKVADNYLWQVARKLSGYRYQARVAAREGITVVRVVIARDGRLLDVEVARSSGVPEFDRGVLAGVRSGSPYAPLPPEIKGDRATFDLPLVSINRQ